MLSGGNDGAVDSYEYYSGDGNDTILGSSSDSHDRIDLGILSWTDNSFHNEGDLQDMVMMLSLALVRG